ncbi:hypothetical protein BJ508DRAFT_331097 [Ascobolus immersus RN42]|uniref:BRCT domain-containing protein n=1 Tax=Ascobolus immersus RN42 TaxID=1160509 RepID=A0A3N4HRG4_ASCIM|nr:hypothetical protein BJ508DRAFT_331097 [Ascobolus immersus RN42]
MEEERPKTLKENIRDHLYKRSEDSDKAVISAYPVIKFSGKLCRLLPSYFLRDSTPKKGVAAAFYLLSIIFAAFAELFKAVQLRPGHLGVAQTGFFLNIASLIAGIVSGSVALGFKDYAKVERPCADQRSKDFAALYIELLIEAAVEVVTYFYTTAKERKRKRLAENPQIVPTLPLNGLTFYVDCHGARLDAVVKRIRNLGGKVERRWNNNSDSIDYYIFEERRKNDPVPEQARAARDLGIPVVNYQWIYANHNQDSIVENQGFVVKKL